MKTLFVPEDVELRGINLMNMHNIVVDRKNKPRYTTTCDAMIEEALISEFIQYGDHIDDDLSQHFKDRVII